MGQHREGFPLAMFLLYAREVLLACGIVPQEQHRGFGEGPLEVGVADLLARSSIAFTSGLFGTLDEPAIGDEFLHAREAADIMDFVEQHEGQDLADPGIERKR